MAEPVPMVAGQTEAVRNPGAGALSIFSIEEVDELIPQESAGSFGEVSQGFTCRHHWKSFR